MKNKTIDSAYFEEYL